MSAGRNINSLSKSWCTPEKYVKAVKAVFGDKIDLDPCSNDYSIVKAIKEFKLPDYDGLKEKWNYNTIFVNPPYGIDKAQGTSIKNWLAKCVSAHIDYNSEVIALIPVAPNTSHWKKYVFSQATAICFLYDTRLRFLENGIDSGKGAPMACAMIYWGNNYKSFYDVFIKFGAVINTSDLIGKIIG